MKFKKAGRRLLGKRGMRKKRGVSPWESREKEGERGKGEDLAGKERARSEESHGGKEGK